MVNSQKSCESQTSQTSQSFIDVSYHAHTRGFNYEISVQNDSLTYTNSTTNITNEKVLLSPEQIEKLENFIKKIDLKMIDELSRPSMGSATDRAAQATLTVATSKNEVYTSSTFDHGNAPEELKEIIRYLEEISK